MLTAAWDKCHGWRRRGELPLTVRSPTPCAAALAALLALRPPCAPLRVRHARTRGPAGCCSIARWCSVTGPAGGPSCWCGVLARGAGSGSLAGWPAVLAVRRFLAALGCGRTPVASGAGGHRAAGRLLRRAQLARLGHFSAGIDHGGSHSVKRSLRAVRAGDHCPCTRAMTSVNTPSAQARSAHERCPRYGCAAPGRSLTSMWIKRGLRTDTKCALARRPPASPAN